MIEFRSDRIEGGWHALRCNRQPNDAWHYEAHRITDSSKVWNPTRLRHQGWCASRSRPTDVVWFAMRRYERVPFGAGH